MSRPEFGFDSSWPRARCPECGLVVALTKGGTFWNHSEQREKGARYTRPPGKCRGTGTRPSSSPASPASGAASTG